MKISNTFLNSKNRFWLILLSVLLIFTVIFIEAESMRSVSSTGNFYAPVSSNLQTSYNEDYTSSANNIFYVSKEGNNTTGTSWANAWNEMDQIDWTSIVAGDVIVLDGGSNSMTYTTTLNIDISGTEADPVVLMKSIESGRNGQVIINGGRGYDLPECGASNYPSYTQLGEAIHVDYDASYVVVDGMEWEGITLTRSGYGIELQQSSHDIKFRNIHVYDNGTISNNSGYYYPDSAGVRLEGYSHVFEMMHVHDNGQDSFQSGGSTPNNLDDITIRYSWLHNAREHSNTSANGGTDGDNPLEHVRGSSALNDVPPNKPNQSFNWCRHSDALQIYAGGTVDGINIEQTILGPGFSNTVILGDNNATVTNVLFTNVVFAKGADNNINFKDTTSASNITMDRVTIYSPNTMFNSLRMPAATDLNIVDSVIYGARETLPDSNVTGSGNCEFNIHDGGLGDDPGNSEAYFPGSLVADPQFQSVSSDAFKLDDYSVNNSNCAGSSITSVDNLLDLINSTNLKFDVTTQSEELNTSQADEQETVASNPSVDENVATQEESKNIEALPSANENSEDIALPTSQAFNFRILLGLILSVFNLLFGI